MHYSLAIAMRYLRARKRSGFVSRVTIIAIGGTLVGVTTLIIVLSLMNGFENELRNRIVEFNTHVLVFTRNPQVWTGIDTVSTNLAEIEGVVASSPFIRGESLISYEIIPGRRVKTKGVIVKGVDLDSERAVSTVIDSFEPAISSFETSGFADGEVIPGIVLGEDLAEDLGRVSYGEILSLVSAPAEMRVGHIKPRTREFRVIGTFKTGVFEFDSRFAYIDIREAETLYDYVGSTRGLGIRIEDIYRAREMQDKIEESISIDYGMNNWITLNSNLFSYIKVEKILMFLLLALIILIAAFNLVGMLTMVIMEKRSEIGILRSMGASSRGIMSIFMVEGTVIGGVGTVLGVVLGLGVCSLLSLVRLDLPPEVYFINTLPVLIEWVDVVTVSVASMVICFIATIYPSWEACNMLPLDAIKYD